MKNRNIRLAIFQAGFDCNADFADAIGLHESTVSRVLNGRRKLNNEQVSKWRETLNCNSDILNEITS